MRKKEEPDPDNVQEDFNEHSPPIMDWDDPYWQTKTPTALIVHALVHKQREVEENHRAKRKEIISDTLPAGIGIYDGNALMITFTGLAGVIIAGLHRQAKNSEEERDQLLKILVEYRENLHDPDTQYSKEGKKEYANKIVNIRISEMNIKLTNIQVLDSQELNSAMSEILALAKGRKLHPRSKVTISDIDNTRDNLIKAAKNHSENIAKNLVAPFEHGARLYYDAFKSCLSDLKSPKESKIGITDGLKTSVAEFNDIGEHKARLKSRVDRKKKANYIMAHNAKNPETTIIENAPYKGSAWRYAEIIKTIEEYNPQQKKALIGFAFATGLAGIGLADLGMNLSNVAMSEEAVSNEITRGIVATACGLALGIGSWGQTGKNTHNLHHALHHKRALAAKEHEPIAKKYERIMETEQLNRGLAEIKPSILKDITSRFSTSAIFDRRPNTHSPHPTPPPREDNSHDI